MRLILYYLIISKLPHSRYSSFFNKIRVLYISKILKICPYDLNTKFENNIYISDAKEITIGKHVRINENVFLQGKISIGDFVMIAPNVAIHSSTHIYDSTDVPMVTMGLSKKRKVIIEDDVWIGRNALILPGIKIGKGSIIGANSVVTKHIEQYSIVGGVPAKLIGNRKQI